MTGEDFIYKLMIYCSQQCVCQQTLMPEEQLLYAVQCTLVTLQLQLLHSSCCYIVHINNILVEAATVHYTVTTTKLLHQLPRALLHRSSCYTLHSPQEQLLHPASQEQLLHPLQGTQCFAGAAVTPTSREHLLHTASQEQLLHPLQRSSCYILLHRSSCYILLHSRS